MVTCTNSPNSESPSTLCINEAVTPLKLCHKLFSFWSLHYCWFREYSFSGYWSYWKKKCEEDSSWIVKCFQPLNWLEWSIRNGQIIQSVLTRATLFRRLDHPQPPSSKAGWVFTRRPLLLFDGIFDFNSFLETW